MFILIAQLNSNKTQFAVVDDCNDFTDQVTALSNLIFRMLICLVQTKAMCCKCAILTCFLIIFSTKQNELGENFVKIFLLFKYIHIER